MTTRWQVVEQSDRIEVFINGNIDALSAESLREAIKRVVIGAGRRRVVLNLSQVPFMDSTGLGALIAGLKSARQYGTELVLTGVSPDLMRIFEITLLERAFTFV